MSKFKSHWFYWHTGHKFIAITSMIISTMGMWLVLVTAAGFSIWGIIIAVLLDAVGFWLAIIYLFVLRGYVTEFMGLQDKADAVVVQQLVIPIVVSFFVSRTSTLFVAKLPGYQFENASE